jgi:hypothetical protein
MRFHKIANVNKALDFIASKGVKLVSIGAEGRNLKHSWFIRGEGLVGATTFNIMGLVTTLSINDTA